jgi:chromosome partitioning protein
MPAKIISFAVRKGGSGKTTTALNVSACLYKMGKRTLIVDLDPQADLTSALGFTEDQVENNNIYKSLMERKISYFKINDLLSIVPSYEDLDDADMSFANAMAREYEVKRLLEPVLDSFDYIIIDCPPSTGFLTRNALACSDYVFIPVQSHVFSTKGLVKMINKINEVKSKLNPKLECRGVFATMFDQREDIQKEAIEKAKSLVPELFMKTIIRKNVSLVESPAQGKDIFDYKESSTGAEDYFNLTNEIVSRVEN